MEPEKDGLPAVQTPEAPAVDDLAQVKKPQELPDDPATEVERLKAEKAEIAEQVKQAQEEKAALEKRLKDNQEYISRTRNAEKVSEPVRPQKTFDDYLEGISKKFEAEPVEGLKQVIRDIAYDRDLERAEHEKKVAEAEERAFKKMLALNPETGKMLKDIEKLDEECPDLQGLSYERKVEFITLRNSGAARQKIDVRGKIEREVGMAGGVGGSHLGGGREAIPSWVNDPEVVAMAQGHFATKQELLTYSDPERARAMYLERVARQRQGQLNQPTAKGNN